MSGERGGREGRRDFGEAGDLGEVERACPCRKRGCPRHGDCRACRDYHGAKGRKPFCER